MTEPLNWEDVINLEKAVDPRYRMEPPTIPKHLLGKMEGVVDAIERSNLSGRTIERELAEGEKANAN